MFFLALILATQLDTVPPKVVHKFGTEDQCLLAAIKLNAKPELNTPEALEAGAEYICLSFSRANY